MNKRPARPIDKSILPDNQRLELRANALDTPERVIAFCKEKGLIDGDILDIERLIRESNELILEKSDIGDYDAYIQKIGSDKFRIVINSKHPITRQRFSMAHEYAHYQLHRTEIANMPMGEQILHRSVERNRVEYEANDFASNILMPEAGFRALVRVKKGNISQIAEALSVSALAVRYRAKNLGISGHGL